jgi:hypothetical protein
MGTLLSLGVIVLVMWGISRITKRWRHQWIAGLALIAFYFKYVTPWVVVAEETRDAHFLDYETLLLGICFLGLELVTNSVRLWWQDDEAK